MWQSLMNAWLLPDLRKRLLFTAFIIAIYRFGSFVPVPGIDLEVIQNLTAGGGVFGFLNLFAGGALQRMAVFALGVIAAIVLIQEGQRRIPVQYAKRVVGRKMYGGRSTYIPLRINMAGVIPVIFATSVLLFPVTLAQMTPWTWVQGLSDVLGPQTWLYLVAEAILIIFFTYFYTAVQFNPIDQADNLKKYGGFIPGIRPGRPTAQYLDRALTRITLPGAVFLAAIAVLPTLLIWGLNVPFFFGGISLLIVVGVALDSMKQMESQLLMRHYEGFLK